MISPTVSTRFVSGRNRIRRSFTAVPVNQTFRWHFTREQAEIFEEFYRVDLIDGTQWFLMYVPLPQGNGPWAFQFLSPYKSGEIIGDVDCGKWVYEATLQQWLRA